MAAEIRGLDGSLIEVAGATRSEAIAEVLKKLTEINDKGRMSAVAVVTIDPEGAYDVTWQWPTTAPGFPWSLAMQGAIHQLLAEIASQIELVGPVREDDPKTD